MRIGSEKEALQLLDETLDASSSVRDEVAQRIYQSMLYHDGIQWLSARSDGYRYGLHRARTSFSPDSPQLRVTLNRTTKLVQKVAAQTNPERLGVEGVIPENDTGSDAMNRARVLEAVAEGAVVDSGADRAAQRANFMRSVAGVWGIMLTLESGVRTVRVGDEEVELPDRRLSAEPFDPCKLVLDPFVEHRDLHMHEHVTYCDVWTLDRIRRVLGVEIDPDDAKTVGELTPTYQAIARMSGGRLFAQFRQFSKAKGAVVYQQHIRGDDGLFERMFVVVQDPREGKRVVNADDPTSPYGHDGLPYVTLHGHQRPESFWSIGDVQMLRDDQNLINLFESTKHRHLQRSAAWKIAVDTRSIDGNQEDFQHQLNNRVGGALFYKTSGSHQDRLQPPQVMRFPDPSPIYDQGSERAQQAMQEQVHRADVNFGRTKSHVPDSSFLRAIEEADQVYGVRIRDDLRQYARLAHLVAGTTVRLAQESTPTTLAMLRRRGLTVDDLGVVLQEDWRRPSVELRIREGSVRNRSFERRFAELVAARQDGVITPMEFRHSAAGDLDAPLTEDDRMFARDAQRWAERIIRGAQWAPIPAGVHSEVYTNTFRRALTDPRVLADPGARQRLVEAIRTQQQAAALEQLQTNPELMASASQQAAPAQPDPAAEGVSMAEALRRLGGPANPQASGV